MGAEVMGQNNGLVAESLPVVVSTQGGCWSLLPKVGGERVSKRGSALNYLFVGYLQQG